MGWPPVRNFVRNNNPVRPAPPPSAPATACPSAQGKGASTSTNTNSLFVKIYMDGVPFGRKVDLRSNNSYDKLYLTLEEMFQQFINGMYYIFGSNFKHFVTSQVCGCFNLFDDVTEATLYCFILHCVDMSSVAGGDL